MLRRLLLGALAGVLTFLGLFALGALEASGLSYMGQADARATEIILGRYVGEIVRFQALLLGLHGLIGALLGVGATLTRRGLSARPQRALVALPLDAAICLGMHALVVARAVHLRPAAYSEWLYERGGALASLQVAVADILPGWLWGAAMALLALASLRGLVSLATDEVASRGPSGKLTVAAVGSVAAGAVAAVVALGSGGAPALPKPLEGKPHVLVVAVDSLRADRLDPGGPAPRMAALAAGGTRIEGMTVPIARTFPSWVSLLTGQLPTRHGVRHMFPRPEVLAGLPEALPGHLGRQGWRTAVVGDYVADIFGRWRAGFEVAAVPTFDMASITRIRGLGIHRHLLAWLDQLGGRRVLPDMRGMAERSDASHLADDALRTFDRLAAGGDPVFMTVFFSGAHFPYAAGHPHRGSRTDSSYRGPWRYRYQPRLDQEPELDEADVRHIRALYDEAVAATDAGVAKLLDALEARGVLDSTVVVLLADHGEELHEESEGFDHGEHLRSDAVLEVPVVISGPGLPAGGVVEGVTRSVDLAPTLLELLGQPPLPSAADGVSLAAQVRAGEPAPGLTAYSETGLWMREAGERFYQVDRLPYPGVVQALEPLDDGGFAVRADLEGRVIDAKHRMVEDRHGRLIRVPTTAGPRREWWPAPGGPAAAPAHLRRALRRILRADRPGTPDGPAVIPATEPSPPLLVRSRLLDRLDEAELEMEGLDASLKRLRGYRRWIFDPWTKAKRPERVGLVLGHKPVPTRQFHANRRALYLPAPGAATWTLSIPEGAKLSLGLLTPLAIPRLAGPGVRFTVELRGAAGAPPKPATILTVDVASKDQEGGTDWLDREVDLGRWAGQRVRLTLRSELLPRPNGRVPAGRAHAFVSAPLILAPGDPGGPPVNVMVVQVDALRPTDLGAFGGPKGLTPVMDALAASGTSFESAIVNHTWTRPSTIALLTGMTSDELGVNRHTIRLPVGQRRGFYAARPPLLPLRLREEGFLVDAAVNNLFMLASHGLGLDFGFQRMGDFRHLVSDTPQVSRSAARFVRENRDRRWFLFVNLNAPHAPYTAPDRYVERVRRVVPGADDLVRQRRGYLAELAYTDEHLGRVLTALKETGQQSRTLVVLTADHGEIMDLAHSRLSAIKDRRSLYHHGITPFDEEVRVPLIFSLPGTIPAGRRVTEQVQTLDFAPTLLELLGLEPDPRHRGRSLAGSLLWEEPLEDRPIRIVGRFFRAVRERGLKYVRHEEDDGTGRWLPTGREELYDLVEDPAEHRDLAASGGPRLDRMRAVFEALEQVHALPPRPKTGPEGAPAPAMDLHLDPGVDPEVRNLLKEWGYL